MKNRLLSFYSKVYQWQYNLAMQFVLWVAQKIDLQAESLFNFQVHVAELIPSNYLKYEYRISLFKVLP